MSPRTAIPTGPHTAAEVEGASMASEHRAQIEALLAAWAHCIDSGRATDAIGLFTQDAEQTLASSTSKGQDAIRAGLERRQALTGRTTRHLVSNLLLQALDGGQRLRGRWVLTLFRSDSAQRPATIQLVADVEDEYAQVDGNWRVARRTLTPVFGTP